MAQDDGGTLEIGAATEDRGVHAEGARALGDRGSRLTTTVVLVCVAALVALTVLGGLLNVGDHLMSVTPVLGWAFYLIVAALVVVGVVVPVVSVARRPVFSLYRLRDESGRARRRHCRMLVDNLKTVEGITPQEVAELERCLGAGDACDDLLIELFERRCVPMIDAETKRAATTAFLATAISHSALVDTVTMLSICLDLVRSIVSRCGFRPTNLGLARLYSRVMLSALVAGGLQDADLDDLIGNLLGGGGGARVGGVILGGATEGLVSAFLVFRVGVITRDWLCAEDGPARMASLRRASYREALTLMRTSGFVPAVADMLKKTAGGVATSVAQGARDAATGAARSARDAATNAADGVMTQVRSAGETAAASAANVFDRVRRGWANRPGGSGGADRTALDGADGADRAAPGDGNA